MAISAPAELFFVITLSQKKRHQPRGDDAAKAGSSWPIYNSMNGDNQRHQTVDSVIAGSGGSWQRARASVWRQHSTSFHVTLSCHAKIKEWPTQAIISCTVHTVRVSSEQARWRWRYVVQHTYINQSGDCVLVGRMLSVTRSAMPRGTRSTLHCTARSIGNASQHCLPACWTSLSISYFRILLQWLDKNENFRQKIPTNVVHCTWIKISAWSNFNSTKSICCQCVFHFYECELWKFSSCSMHFNWATETIYKNYNKPELAFTTLQKQESKYRLYNKWHFRLTVQTIKPAQGSNRPSPNCTKQDTLYRK